MSAPLTDPAFQFRDINFWIADVGPDKPGIDSEYSEQDAALNLTLRVDWDLRKEARRALIGGTTFVAGPDPNTPGHLSRELPHCYQDEEFWLWCKRATIMPEVSRSATAGISGQVPGALYALIKARYEPRDYELLEDDDIVGADGFHDEGLLRRYVSYPEPRSKDRVLSMRAPGWRFVDRVEAIPVAIGTNINEVEETLIWNQVPVENIPKATIASLYAKSNANVFNGKAVGTYVFSDYSYKNCPRLPNGKLAQNVYFTFTFKPFGANFFPDPSRGNRFFEVIAMDGSGNKPHPPTADFRQLLRPVAPS